MMREKNDSVTSFIPEVVAYSVYTLHQFSIHVKGFQ